MRILFYIEPYPIRDMTTHFKDIALKFLPLLETGPRLDTRLFANRATLAAIQGSIEKYANRIVRPDEEDEKIVGKYQKAWLDEGISDWLDLMAGTGQVTRDYVQVLERIWQRFPFDVIVHWGENGAVTRFIEGRNITRIAMEMGCTRPPFLDSIVMDPYGTNGAGVVPKLSISDLRDIVGGKPMSRYEAMLAYSENIEARTYEEQFQPVLGDLMARIGGEGKLAFLPLQLFDDANLLRFSPYETLSDVVLDVVPKLAAAKYTTIITPHPASKHRPQGVLSTTAAKAALRPWMDQVIWLDPNTERPLNTQLIAMSDVVVTVNSSVGFEATYFDKPIIVLGDAVYKPQGLFPTLENFLSGRFDVVKYRDGVGILRRFLLGGYLQANRARADVSSFERSVGLIDRLWRHHADDPVAVARGLWQATSASTQTYAESAAFSGYSVAGQQEFIHPASAKPAAEVALAPAITASKIRWMNAARRLILQSRATDIAQFSAWLSTAMSGVEGVTNVVTTAHILNVEEYLDLYPDVKKVGVNPLKHYIRHGMSERRKPQKHLPGVTAEQIEENIIAAATVNLSQEGGILRVYPLMNNEFNIREGELNLIRQNISGSERRIAVVSHLYYTDLVPYILERLRAIPEEFDLIVTLPDWGNRRIEAMVRQAFPKALFYHAANRGRDIGPFVDLLPLLIDRGYDAVLKIQTKRGYYVAGKLRAELGDLWREESFDALLGSTERVTAILEAFRSRPDLAMVGPEPHYLSLTDYPYHDEGALAQAVLGDGPADGFFAGTMFWVRPSSLSPLVDPLGLSITSFAPETGANDGALAHIIERLFGHAATIAGAVLGAPIDPIAPLCDPLAPLAVKMHDRIELALKNKIDNSSMKKLKGALAW